MIQPKVFSQEILLEKKSKILKAGKSSGSRTNKTCIVEMENGDVFKCPAVEGVEEGEDLDYTLKLDPEGKPVVVSINGNKVESSDKPKNPPPAEKKKKRAKSRKPLVPFFDSIPLESLMFIDVETVRVQDKIKTKTDLYDSWEYKMRKTLEDPSVQDIKKSFEEKAPLYAEFGKIACISMGFLVPGGGFKIKTFQGDEAELLENFNRMIQKINKKKFKLCGHSIIGFDIPFIERRMWINGIRPHVFLNTVEEKPWTLSDKFVDISSLWKNTSFYGASLLNLAVAMGLPSPKSKLDGSKVSDHFYRSKAKDPMKEIVEYCERDVFTTFNIISKLYGKDPLTKYETV